MELCVPFLMLLLYTPNKVIRKASIPILRHGTCPDSYYICRESLKFTANEFLAVRLEVDFSSV